MFWKYLSGLKINADVVDLNLCSREEIFSITQNYETFAWNINFNGKNFMVVWDKMMKTYFEIIFSAN